MLAVEPLDLRDAVRVMKEENSFRKEIEKLHIGVVIKEIKGLASNYPVDRVVLFQEYKNDYTVCLPTKATEINSRRLLTMCSIVGVPKNYIREILFE